MLYGRKGRAFFISLRVLRMRVHPVARHGLCSDIRRKTTEGIGVLKRKQISVLRKQLRNGGASHRDTGKDRDQRYLKNMEISLDR